MARSRTLLFSVALLVVSLGWKIAQSDETSGALDHEMVTVRLASFVASHGYEVLQPQPFDDYKLIMGYRRECRILAAVLPEEGFASSSFEKLAEANESVTYRFDGSVYAHHPLVKALLTKYIDRILRGVGIIDYARPVVGVSVSAECALPDASWHDMRKVLYGNQTS